MKEKLFQTAIGQANQIVSTLSDRNKYSDDFILILYKIYTKSSTYISDRREYYTNKHPKNQGPWPCDALQPAVFLEYSNF
jgi:hypothetical protein